MPCDYTKYHPDFKKVIRPKILHRAHNCCEECGINNYAIVTWNKDLQRHEKMYGNLYYDAMIYTRSYKEAKQACDLVNECEHDRYIVIVLTISHLDHDISNNSMDNLKAMCQRCHLKHDKQYHIQNAKDTLAKKKGIQKLF